MSFVSTPDPCNNNKVIYPNVPFVPKRNHAQFNNLGGYGSYAAMRKTYLPEHKNRYIWVAGRQCCRGPEDGFLNGDCIPGQGGRPPLCYEGQCLPAKEHHRTHNTHHHRRQHHNGGYKCLIPAKTNNSLYTAAGKRQQNLLGKPSCEMYNCIGISPLRGEIPFQY